MGQPEKGAAMSNRVALTPILTIMSGQIREIAVIYSRSDQP